MIPTEFDARAAIERRVQDLGLAWRAALESRDPAAIGRFLHPDSMLLLPGSARVRGRDRVTRSWRAALRGPLWLELGPFCTRAYPAGGIVHQIGRYRVVRNGDVRDAGSHLLVWTRSGEDWWVRTHTFYSRCSRTAREGDRATPPKGRVRVLGRIGERVLHA